MKSPGRISSLMKVPARFVCIFALAKIIVSLGPALASSAHPRCIYGLQICLFRYLQKENAHLLVCVFGGTGQI